MGNELGKISIYLAKEGASFDDVIDESKISIETENFKIREFEVNGHSAKFFCKQTTIEKKKNPPWLNFVNEKLESDENKINFYPSSKRCNGLLLIEINKRILAASFGIAGSAALKKIQFLDDFGIKTAMNMCGNKVLRQTKSSTHTITTQNIDRQLSRPSDSFSFGLNDTEFLQYISAHIPSDNNATLQGKDNLTLKIIGDDKLSWDKLIEYGKTFIEKYSSDEYKELFPNYPNLENISKDKSDEIDLKLAEMISRENFNSIHLAIPEFIADDDFSFSYTNYNKRENKIFSHVDIKHLKSENVLNFKKIKIEDIKNSYVYAYSHEQDQILGYKKWELYCCIVAEIELNDEYFVLSNGTWKKVDDEFYKAVTKFVDEVIEVEEISDKFHNINISDLDRKQNREEVFNKRYCDLNKNTVLFDKAKLRIGQGSKDKEFCDVLEYRGADPAWIIHVKKYGGADAINYLFSQARFYCEFFLSDEVFLNEIRDHISKSPQNTDAANNLLSYVKETQSKLNGKDYAIKLWLLFDKKEKLPKKSDLPLIAKYELKLTYEKLKNISKYNDIKLSMIPVECVSFTTAKKNIK